MARRVRGILLDDNGNPTFRVGLGKIVLVACIMPITAFVFCIVYSVLYDFDRSTRTKCLINQAYNVLPSVSAAIGNSPQWNIWTLAICIHSPPRFLLLFFNVQYNFQVLSPKVSSLVYVLAVLNFIENVALLGLSFFDSFHYYQIYMLLNVVVQWCCRRTPRNAHEITVLSIKTYMVFVNILAFILAAYYYTVHNTYCLDYAYTKFAICEYIMVFSNIAYHGFVFDRAFSSKYQQIDADEFFVL